MQLVTSKRNAVIGFFGILIASMAIGTFFFSGGSSEKTVAEKGLGDDRTLNSTGSSSAPLAGSESSAAEPGAAAAPGGAAGIIGAENDSNQATGGSSPSSSANSSSGTAAPGSTAGSADTSVSNTGLQVLDENAQPYSVAPNGNMIIIAHIIGEATEVKVAIAKQMDATFEVYSLAMNKGATDENGVTTWSINLKAPSVTGIFTHTVFATGTDGKEVKRVPPDGASGPNYDFEVK